MDLTAYDLVLLNTSGGKDSSVMAWNVAKMAEAQGVKDRLVLGHATFREEWKGTVAVVKKQAEQLGISFHVVTRGEALLDYVRRRKMWPSSMQRYCTSDFKRAPIDKLITKLAPGIERRVRVLNVMGLRAQESPARAKKVAFKVNERRTNGRRHVDDWLPILDMKIEEVWETIKANAIPQHVAYSLGMPRLSCVFCLAGDTEVVTRSGLRTIRELSGGRHELLIPKSTKYGLSSHGKFEEVRVSEFGQQPLIRVALRRERQKKVLYATPEHRWLLIEGKRRPNKKDGQHNGYDYVTAERITSQLQRGDKLRWIQAQPPTKTERVPFAIAQGFVYGDGCTGSGDRPASLSIYSLKKDGALLPFFAAHRIKTRKSHKSYTSPTHLHIYGLPRLWKEAPDFRESRAFLLSWLSGYFAADGCVSEAGQARLDSASIESINLARSIAAICGIGYGPRITKMRIGTGTRPSALHSMTLNVRDLPDWFFVIKSHHKNARHRMERTSGHERLWSVVSVKPTKRDEVVYCAIVPKAKSFALADEVLTGNCIFAPKSALILAGKQPENRELLKEYVQVEKEIGHDFREGFKIAEVLEAVESGTDAGPVNDWKM